MARIVQKLFRNVKTGIKVRAPTPPGEYDWEELTYDIVAGTEHVVVEATPEPDNPPERPVNYDDVLAAREKAQHLPTEAIKGYRQLSAVELETVNEIKDHAQKTLELIESLGAANKDILKVDSRWISIARTDLQKGYMSLIRAVTRPTGF